MAADITELKARSADSEKVTVNLGYVDLGLIDLLVAEKFYSNRTDFIRTAIRNQLERQSEATKQSATRKSLELGLRVLSRRELEDVRRQGVKLELRVLGLVTIASDVTPELALAAIGSIEVLGALHASPAVKAALADRVT